MPKLTKQADIKREQRRAVIAKLYCEGFKMDEIRQHEAVKKITGKALAIGTISGDIKAIKLQWAKENSEKIDEKIDIELAKLDHMEAVAWESFYKSMTETTKSKRQTKRDGLETKESKKAGKPPKPEVQEDNFIQERETAGDPRFLNIIDKCIERRCKLLGIGSPESIKLDGKIEHVETFDEKAQSVMKGLAQMIKEKNVPVTDSELDENSNY